MTKGVNCMSVETAKDKAITKFFYQFGNIAAKEELEIKIKRIRRLFTPSYYSITITAYSNGLAFSETYNIPDKQSLFQSPIIRLYVFLYLLLTFLFIIGIRNNFNFYEIIYFSPMIFGFFYYKCCYPYLGELLKKQADTFSFFLGMLTACSLSLKISNFHITILSFISDWMRLTILFLVLQLFCIFISVKFYISAYDLLKSMKNNKNSRWNWLLELLS